MNFLLTQEDFMSILRRDILQTASLASLLSATGQNASQCDQPIMKKVLL